MESTRKTSRCAEGEVAGTRASDATAAPGYFEARVHRSKDRLVAIPAALQRELGLKRIRNNHLVYCSIRRKVAGRGRGKRVWMRHWFKLTRDNEFAIPVGVSGIKQGDSVEVKIHRIVPDRPMYREGGSACASVLLELAREAGDDERRDGSRRVDDYLYDSLDHAE